MSRRIQLVAAVLAVGVAGPLTAFALPAEAAVSLKAVVTLSPASSTVGQRVIASVSRSTKPRGDVLKSIRLNWGDGTKAVVLSDLSKRATHRYSRPGRYTVAVRIVDRNDNVDRGTSVEHVTAPAGSYTGSDPNYSVVDPISFYVSHSHTRLQDIFIPYVYLTCAPGGAPITDHLTMTSAAVATSGSFSASTVQHGVYRSAGIGYPATYRFAFAGRFTGLSSTGRPMVAGTFRETLTFTDSAARTCTSNIQSWSGTRDAQPRQTNAAPPVGSYTGKDADYSVVDPVTFFVSADKTKVQDVFIPYVYLDCAPGPTTITDHLGIPAIPLTSSGSFNRTVTQHGVYKGFDATFTYTFHGNFHSVDPSGTPRAAGSFRETLTFTDTAARSCSSNLQSWSATRDGQPSQPPPPPTSGNYSGTIPDYSVVDPVTFSVSNGTVNTIAIPTVYLTCAPGGSTPNTPLTITSAPITAAGSFTATAVDNDMFNGHPATYTYVFSGTFHGVDPNGVPRAAGTFSETLSYTDSVARTCMSNNQYWAATLS